MIGPIPDDPVIVTIVLILLALVFFGYLLLRKTVLEFREGLEGR